MFTRNQFFSSPIKKKISDYSSLSFIFICSCRCYLNSQVPTRSVLAFSFFPRSLSTTFSHGLRGGGSRHNHNDDDDDHRQPQYDYWHHHHHHCNRYHSVTMTIPIARLEKKHHCSWVFPLFSCYPQVKNFNAILRSKNDVCETFSFWYRTMLS